MKFVDLYARLDKEQRETLAERAGTKPVYLYQLSRRIRRPSIDLMVKLCEADSRLKLKDMVAEFAA